MRLNKGTDDPYRSDFDGLGERAKMALKETAQSGMERVRRMDPVDSAKSTAWKAATAALLLGTFGAAMAHDAWSRARER